MPTAFKMVTVVLYQPDDILRQRLRDVKELAAFSGAIAEAAAAEFPLGSAPRELDIVVALKPGGGARFWLVSTQQGDADSRLLSRLEPIPAPSVQSGPVAFAIIGSISGAPTSASAVPFVAPMPQEWRDAAAKAPAAVVVRDGILAIAWPD